MTTVRLAYNPGPIEAYGVLNLPTISKGATLTGKEAPNVRLAATASMIGKSKTGQYRYPFQKDYVGGETNLAPALLVSYVYLDAFLKNKPKYHYRDWVMDSGAFSAWKSGTEIDLQKYIDTARKLIEEDETLSEVYSLDVIGDWEGTARNTEEMWRQGIPAIPAFHHGEPEEALLEMAEKYPKIALGGIVGVHKKEKKRWIGQCFARVWPKKIHGFGVGTKDIVMSFPFHSVDATNWELGPCAYGRWNSYGKMSIRGSKQDLRVEVKWYLDLERKARNRWRKEMELLDANDGGQ